MARKRNIEKDSPVLKEAAVAAKPVRGSANPATHRRKQTAAEESRPIPQPIQDDIAVRAYLIAESRGFQGGSMEEDWLAAERQLMAARAARARNAK